MKSGPLLAAALVACFAVASTGCDKVKSMAGGAGGSLFGSDFEGEITMTAVRAKGSAPTDIVFGIKKPKYRIDTAAPMQTDNPMMSGGGAVILDPPAKKGYLLIAPQKKAMVLDFEKMKGMQAGVPRAAGGPGVAKKPSGPPPTIEKTGKKDTVAGYSCEIWKVTQNDGRRADICVADGITWFDLGDLGWSSPEMTVAAVASGANRFPLRVVTYGPTGAEETRFEAKKIDKKKLDDARFVVPPDYQIIDLSQMLGNFGQMGAPGTPPAGMPSGMPSGFVMPNLPRKR